MNENKASSLLEENIQKQEMIRGESDRYLCCRYIYGEIPDDREMIVEEMVNRNIDAFELLKSVNAAITDFLIVSGELTGAHR